MKFHYFTVSLNNPYEFHTCLHNTSGFVLSKINAHPPQKKSLKKKKKLFQGDAPCSAKAFLCLYLYLTIWLGQGGLALPQDSLPPYPCLNLEAEGGDRGEVTAQMPPGTKQVQ